LQGKPTIIGYTDQTWREVGAGEPDAVMRLVQADCTSASIKREVKVFQGLFRVSLFKSQIFIFTLVHTLTDIGRCTTRGVAAMDRCENTLQGSRPCRMIPGLPDELSLSVLQQLANPAHSQYVGLEVEEEWWSMSVLPALLALSTVSRRLHAEVEPLLYQRFLGGADAISRRSFLRTVTNNSKLARHVKHLSWNGHNARWTVSESHCVPSRNPDIEVWIERLFNLPLSARTRLRVYEGLFLEQASVEFFFLLLNLPEVTTLYHDSGNYTSGFYDVLAESINQVDNCAKLKPLACLERAFVSQPTDLMFSCREVMCCVRLPSLRSMTMLGNERIFDPEPHFQPSTSIKDLTILKCDLNNASFDRLMQYFESLESLHVESNSGDPELIGYLTAMEHCRESLCSFRFSMNKTVLSEPLNKGSLSALRSFRDYPRLASMDVVDIALGCMSSGAPPCLVSFLPPSIEQFTLTAWLYDQDVIQPMLEGLAQQKDRFPLLKIVRLRHPDWRDVHLIKDRFHEAGVDFNLEQ